MKLACTTLACPGWSIEEAVSTAREHGYAAIAWRLADGALILNSPGAWTYCQPGEGDVPLGEICSELRYSGYAGYLSLE